MKASLFVFFVSVLEARVWMKNLLSCASGLHSYSWIWVGLFSLKNQCCWKRKALILGFSSHVGLRVSLPQKIKCTLTLWRPPWGVVSIFLCANLTFDCMLSKLCLSFLKYVFFIKKIKSSDEIAVISYVIRGGMKCLCFYLEKIWQINFGFSVLQMQ